MSEAPHSAQAHPDPLWQEVCDFVARNQVSLARTLAPRELAEQLGGSVSYEQARERELSDFDCLVLHKGWLGQLPQRLLVGAVRRLLPAFANPVFVIYARDVVEPITAVDHLKSFLEQLPDAEAPVAERAPVPAPPLVVFTGNDRLICRDPDFRKLLLPARGSALLCALMEGRNVVTELREALRPVIAGARRVLDFGAGIGLFTLVARELAAQDARFQGVETEPLARGCLVANVDLAGLYWRTQVLAERPERLAALTRDAHDGGQALRNDGRPRVALTGRCDVLHVDLDFGLRERVEELPQFLQSQALPAVVLSRGLACRSEPVERSDAAGVEACLLALGYRADPEGEAPGTFDLATLQVFRARSNVV